MRSEAQIRPRMCLANQRQRLATPENTQPRDGTPPRRRIHQRVSAPLEEPAQQIAALIFVEAQGMLEDIDKPRPAQPRQRLEIQPLLIFVKAMKDIGANRRRQIRRDRAIPRREQPRHHRAPHHRRRILEKRQQRLTHRQIVRPRQSLRRRGPHLGRWVAHRLHQQRPRLNAQITADDDFDDFEHDPRVGIAQPLRPRIQRLGALPPQQVLEKADARGIATRIDEFEQIRRRERARGRKMPARPGGELGVFGLQMMRDLLDQPPPGDGIAHDREPRDHRLGEVIGRLDQPAKAAHRVGE